MNNYEASRDRAQAFFLTFDQAAVAARWGLKTDERWLYVTFRDQPYRICRETGSVFRCRDSSRAGFEEVLSIFDLLCHEGREKFTSGNYAPVNSLKNRPRAIGVDTGFHSRTAAVFDRDPAAFRSACLSLGGIPVSMGDLGFCFSLFGPLDVILKFYHADEDFPAAVTFLWDDEILRFVHYETVFYIAGFLLQSILEAMV